MIKYTEDMSVRQPTLVKRPPKKYNYEKVQEKNCLWCGTPIEVRRRTKLEYSVVKTHQACVAAYRHHKCSKSDLKERVEHHCLKCGKILTQKEGEYICTWLNRKYCDRLCSSTHQRKPPVVNPPLPIIALEAIHAVVYKPGTEEFLRIARLYDKKL